MTTPDKLKREYLDRYEGVQSEVLHTTRFDESSDLSTTYLGRTDMTRATTIKAEERFAISEQGYMVGKLLDDTECQILLDMGVSKSYMSKSYYLRCKSLHSLPKFAFQNTKNTSRKWVLHWYVVHYTSGDRYTWPQI